MRRRVRIRIDITPAKPSGGLQPETPCANDHEENIVNITDYVIDLLLIVVIFRQVRPHQLTLHVVLLLAVAGAIYLRPPFTLGGNDLALIVILVIAGIVLGALSGLGDRVWRDNAGNLLFRATAISVIAWILGMGFRFGFAYYAYHSGGPSVARFSPSATTSPARLPGRPRWS